MDFNPLDLLASAAELQQKNDGPERIIVTRQKRNTSNISKHVVSNIGQKENQEIHTNNNNNVKTKPKPSVVVVKKIKLDNLNPDLEKMFDEHNYGNSKKTNNKYEQTDEHGYDLNKRKKKAEVVSNSSQCHSHYSETASSESESRENKVTTLISVGSQAGDSDSERVVGKCSVNSSKDKGTCSSTGSHCSSNRTPAKLENETTENKCTYCVESQCSCWTSTREHSDSEGQITVNSSCTEDKQREQHMVMKYKGTHSEHGILTPSSELLKSDVDCLKLDDKTGEFITASGAKVIVKSFVDSKINKEKLNEECDLKKTLSDTNEEKVVHRMVAVKNVKNFKHDSNTAKSTSIITSAKMPYVKVIPTKEINSEAVLDSKPETLVINISRGHSSSSQTTKSAVDDQSSQQCETNNMCGSDNTSEPTKSCNNVGVIKSIVVNDKVEGSMKNREVGIVKPKPMVFTMLPSKSRLEMPSVDSSKFHSTNSCESLKTLELSNSMCSDDSVSSVHLLSPDRRNPDSMGIVESPLIQNCGDLFLDRKEKDKVTFPFSYSDSITNSNTINEKGDNSGIIKQDESCTSGVSVIGSNNGVKDSDCNDCSVEEDSVRDSASDTRELMEESRLDPGNTQDNGDNSANDSITDSSGNEVPIFRFDSDHCYAGAPSASEVTAKQQILNETEEPCTPLGSSSELSQDSGYGDVGQSPDTETPTVQAPVTPASVTPASVTPEEIPVCHEKSLVKNLVPVLVSVNTNGSLTLHDTNLTQTLGGPVLALPDKLPNSGIKVIPGTSLPSGSHPLILSPVGKGTSPILAENTRIVPAKSKGPESIIELLCPKRQDQCSPIPIVQASQQISPPKFGTFKIGTFASFSNTGMGIESNSPVITDLKNSMDMVEDKVKKSVSRPRSNSGKSSPAASDSLNSLVQKVKGSLSQSHSLPSPEGQGLDHIQHDHDYCTKNLMPSVVSSLLEARLLSKDIGKKVSHGKGKKIDHEQVRDLHKMESKSGKRKRNSASLTKHDSMDDYDMDSESDSQSIPEQPKIKSRLEKYLEKPGRTTDPKVKITGSSNFQDQFVYFMNTKKRSRRRESKDTPLALGDRLIIPPKPGDIVVPHLTEQDIENLKLRSKQFKQSGNISGFNSLRNEFMAAKYANTPYSGLFSETTGVVDEEKNIINTILSMENENLASPVQSDPPSYNESMELYGQGIGNELMSLFPEQMNLTQEQMELLYSAVDEVQNSSPGLIGEEKSTDSDNSSFSQFPIPEFDTKGSTSTGSKSEVAATETVTMETAKDKGAETKVQSSTDKESKATTAPETTGPAEVKLDRDLKESTTTPIDEATDVPKTDSKFPPLTLVKLEMHYIKLARSKIKY